MTRFRPVGEEEPEPPELSWWQEWQSRFWEWWYYGTPKSPRQVKKKPLVRQRFTLTGLYADMVNGELTEPDLYERLHSDQVADFIALHQTVRNVMDGEGELPRELVVPLAQAFTNRRRLVFVLYQIDNMIEDLEREVSIREMNANIVRRE